MGEKTYPKNYSEHFEAFIFADKGILKVLTRKTFFHIGFAPNLDQFSQNHKDFF